MKLSRFNVFFTHNEDMFVANTFSKAIIKLDKRHFDALSSGDPDMLAAIGESIDELANQGILVDEDVDELGV